MYRVIYDEYDNNGDCVGRGLDRYFDTREEAESFAKVLKDDPLCERIEIEYMDDDDF